MRCRNCGATQPIGLSLRLSGLLRAARGRRTTTRSSARRSPARRSRPARPGIWRYLELLPGRRAAGARPAGRLDAAAAGRPAGADARARPAVDQGRHPQPVAVVQGPGGRGRRGARRRLRRRGARLRVDRQPGRRDRGRRGRASGCRPTCSSRPTSSRPRSTTRWPTARRSSRSTGTYDDVNRLCLEVADETGWGFVNINLRPFYAEGSQDARLRDRRVARLAVARRRRRARSRRARCSPASRAASRSWPSSG